MAVRSVALRLIELEHRVNHAMIYSAWIPVPAKTLYGRLRSRLALAVYRSKRCPVPTSPNRVLATLLYPGSVYIDVGAAEGEMVCLASNAVANQGAVYAFEPRDTAVAHLERMIAAYRMSNVRLTQSLVGDTNGSTMLFSSEGSGASSSIAATWAGSTQSKSYPTCMLDGFATEAALAQVDLVKIDVEGGEQNVLRGAQGVMRTFHPALVFEIRDRELRRTEFGYDIGDIMSLLRSAGYDLFYCLRPGGFEPVDSEIELGADDHDMVALSSSKLAHVTLTEAHPHLFRSRRRDNANRHAQTRQQASGSPVSR